jgi:hypothetical protein
MWKLHEVPFAHGSSCLLWCVFVGGVDSGGGLYGGVEPPFACVEKVGMFPPYIEG